MADDLLVARFERDGFVGPIPLLDRTECRRVAAYLSRDSHPAPEWSKGRAVRERTLYELATHPRLLSLVSALIGPDVVLWGASAVSRGPGAVHPWHSDIESCAPDGRFVTAWIGIEHTSRDSALQVIAGSHALGVTVQEARLARGWARAAATPEAMLGVARQTRADAVLAQPDMTDGEAILFDGRLWHGSDNTRRAGTRTALLFQYAAARCPVRMPDPAQLDWPFRFQEEPRPATILVAGSAIGSPNRIVPPPPADASARPTLTTALHAIRLPYADSTERWHAMPYFRGPTSTIADMACHASVLAPAHTPHPPHAHEEEELLIPLSGEVELRISAAPDDPAPRVERVRPGAFVYYPAGQLHTITNPGTEPVGYLMFKWRAGRAGAVAPLGTSLVRFGDVTPPAHAPAFWTQVLLEGPTALLGRLHAHLTELAPGAGYAPHADAYDVAIVLLDGTIDTLDARLEAPGVAYCSAGREHGMRNPGTRPARYLVFEFHHPGHEGARGDAAPWVVRAAKRALRPLWHRTKPLLPARLRNRL